MARTVVEHEVAPERLRMSYEEWHAWLGEELNRGEWVNGEVIVFAMPKVIHQDLLLFLARLLAGYVDRFQLGRVFIAGIEMWLAGRRTARLPDLLFVARAHLDRLTPDRLDGPADLVIEIISDDSVRRDRRDKFREYEAVGIPEYWLVDPRPRGQWSAFYQIGADGRYRQMPLDEQGRYHSRALPGFWLDPAWLWQDPRPKPIELLTAIVDQAPGRS